MMRTVLENTAIRVNHNNRGDTMKKLLCIFAAICFTAAVSDAGDTGARKYMGVRNCSMCHKGEAKGKMFEIWQASKHAGAYKTLLTPEAKKIAEKKGLKKSAGESPECLKCHVTAHGVDAKLLDAKFDMKDGIGCESCHGPGSEYKAMGIMKDRAKAVAAGLIIGKDDEKLCKKCHNSESPTYAEFKYKEFWAKVKHPLPKK
jgi:cytochrome c peroxidase